MPQVASRPNGGARSRQRPAEAIRVEKHSKPSPAGVRRFEVHIRGTYPDVAFDLTATRGMLAAGVIELTRIVVPERKRGIGTAIVREVCEFADRHALDIRLTPASKGDYTATTSRGRLVRFYKRFGFVVENARPGGFNPVPAMLRKCHRDV